MREIPLLPAPRTLVPRTQGLALPARVTISGSPGRSALSRLGRALERRGRSWEPAEDAKSATVTFERGAVEGGDEAYRLGVDARRATVTAATDAGLAHGASTLAQLVDAARAEGEDLVVPGVEIVDHPALSRRGVMLDVSRGRVPTMDTLFALVERFAGWKFNHLQLYTEHTFAYDGHEEVWREASPMLPAEVRALDAFCRERHIELVANQNCFGHMHRWLTHERYRPLSEVPEGVIHPFALQPEPFSLCPTDPRSLALIEDLLDQLLPCFSSDEVNVGLDETFDLGLGRSKQACAERGVGRVYLDFLRAVHRCLADRGKRMQFWADILLNHPELVDEVPRDCVAMIWGYEADHPFEQQTAAVARSGLPFFVCPGTSSWQSFSGRTAKMRANIEGAVRSGVAAGAEGMLVTDWGDRGHLQGQAVSYAGWGQAAASAWNPLGLDDLTAALDLHAFGDSAGRAAAAALELGRVEEVLDSGATNGSAPFFLVAMIEDPVPGERAPRLTRDGLERGMSHLDAARSDLVEARLERADGPLLREELTLAADMTEFGLRLGLARLAAGGEVPAAALPAGVRADLAQRLRPLIDGHRRLWRMRCRPGGLEESEAWLTRVLALIDP